MYPILSLEHYAGKALADISLNGLFLDKEYLRELMKGWGNQRLEKALEFFRIANRDPNNAEQAYKILNSPKQLSNLLYNDLKFTRPRKEISASQYKTDLESIEYLQKAFPNFASGDLFGNLLGYRKYTKLLSTYGGRLIDRCIGGFLYPNINIGDAETGRTTSNSPNIQNIPLIVRPAFCSRFPDGVLKGVDLSQIELRVAAFVSKDQYMMEAFRTGRDFHSETAVRMFGLEYDKITKEQRRVAKIINFGVLYLAGPGRIADEAGCSYEEARNFIGLYFKTFSGLANWIEETLDIATERKKVISPLGRIRRVPFADRRTPEGMKQCREAVNAVIQGMASDIALMFASLMYRTMRNENRDSIMVPAWVHDFFMVDAFRTESELLDQDIQVSLSMLRSFMRSRFGLDFDVPLAADIDTGYRWDDKSNTIKKITNLPGSLTNLVLRDTLKQ